MKKENSCVYLSNRDSKSNVYSLGICSGEIIRRATPIMIKGETKENKASIATTRPAAGMGRPLK